MRKDLGRDQKLIPAKLLLPFKFAADPPMIVERSQLSDGRYLGCLPAGTLDDTLV